MTTEEQRHIAELEKRAETAEKARREIEARYRMLSDNTLDVIATLDRHLHYTYVSPSVKHVRGFDPDELIGRQLSSICTAASMERSQRLFSGEELKQKTDGGTSDATREIELEMYKKDGSTILTESRVSLLRDENGRHIGYMTVSRDVDEARKINAQLQESEEKFRSLAEACLYGILIYQDDYWVYTNPAGEEITGYSAEELYKWKFWEIVDPEYQPLLKERGVKRQAGEKLAPTYNDFKIKRVGSSEGWVSLTSTSCTYKGRPAGMITVQDITTQKQRQQALLESEEKYRTIIENIEEGYYEVDIRGNFTFFNEAICAIAGRPCDEVWGVNYREYTPPGEARKLFTVFSEIYQTGKPARAFDLEVLRADGESRHVEISASLMRGHSGEPIGFRGIMRDITDRKKAEEERTRLEAQLMHAHKMEAVGTLAGGIAHDFNNILQAISGYTQLLLMNKNTDHPDYNKLIELEKAGERAAGLIQQLLTFSRKVGGERRLVSFNKEIVSVQRLLKQTIPKMIDINVDMDDDLWLVNGDPLHIEQILLNLATNAADAMPDGGKLTIETQNVVLDETYCKDRVEAVPGNYVLLKFSDSGCGMDPETLRHIFDPFYTTKAVGKGTGLGLASVYGIVKDHGGRIYCYSEIGQGTIFSIYFPAVLKEDVGIDKKQKAIPSPQGGKENILVIDDEPTVRDMAREMLEYYGYGVICAEDGESAIEVYRENASGIDLVILDLNMPGMGGYKCMQGLLDINPESKILIASGYSTDFHAKQALSAGAAAFIGKPYHLQEMARKVRSALDNEV